MAFIPNQQNGDSGEDGPKLGGPIQLPTTWPLLALTSSPRPPPPPPRSEQHKLDNYFVRELVTFEYEHGTYMK